MSKRNLSRRQSWRIDKIQSERMVRAQRREERVMEELEDSGLGPEQEGLVIAHFGVQVEVESSDKTRCRCYMRANLPALVTGDRVVWREGSQGLGVIVAQLPRHSELCRPDMHGQLKPVAANVDQMLIMFAPIPEPHANLIDRYLVAASHSDIQPILLLNKADLLGGDECKTRRLLETYAGLGYQVLLLSAQTGQGMQELEQLLHQRISVVVGQSGVGKSSLVNRLLPDADTAVGALSELVGKGRHTTTTARLFHFPSGGSLIDSPGIREFGLAHVDAEDIEAGFIELHPYLGRCKFRDCNHVHEPGCALLSAIEQGKVSQERFNSFKALLNELAD